MFWWGHHTNFVETMHIYTSNRYSQYIPCRKLKWTRLWNDCLETILLHRWHTKLSTKMYPSSSVHRKKKMCSKTTSGKFMVWKTRITDKLNFNKNFQLSKTVCHFVLKRGVTYIQYKSLDLLRASEPREILKKCMHLIRPFTSCSQVIFRQASWQYLLSTLVH